MAIYGDGLDQLYPNHDDSCLEYFLADGWGVHGPGDAHRVLRWLLEEGHEQEFQARRSGTSTAHPARDAFVAAHPDVTTIRAWDLGRLPCVARWAYAFGYLEEDEAWDWVFRGARVVQAEFGSWQEFLRSYRAGNEYWSEDTYAADEVDALRDLLEPTKGALAKLPWDQDLSER